MSDETRQAEGNQAIVKWEPESATEAWALAKYYGASKLIPKALSQTADVFLVIAAGRDFGWSPMQSMRGLYVVEGKPALSADAMVGIAKSNGLCEWFRMVESTAEIATYETQRKGDPGPVRMSFTIKEAQAAGLTNKGGPWKSYPARMLRNRCKSALAKEVYEELFFGAYEESEAEEIPRRAERGPSKAEILAAAPAVAAAVAHVERITAAPVATPVASVQTVEVIATPPEPPHDAVTGEVVEDPLFAGEETLADKMTLRIGAAKNIRPDLTGIAAEIEEALKMGLLKPFERESLFALLSARKQALTARAA